MTSAETIEEARRTLQSIMVHLRQINDLFSAADVGYVASMLAPHCVCGAKLAAYVDAGGKVARWHGSEDAVRVRWRCGSDAHGKRPVYLAMVYRPHTGAVTVEIPADAEPVA